MGEKRKKKIKEWTLTQEKDGKGIERERKARERRKMAKKQREKK